MRPSELLAIEGAYRAYCLDQATYTFGVALENAIKEGTAKLKTDKAVAAKTMDIVRRWTGQPRQFRNPAALVKRTG